MVLKKVLILAYDFPPYVSVGGLRPYSWYKYFHEFGIYPIVITRQWGNKYGNHLDYIAPGESDEAIIEESDTGTIIRTPYKPNWANRIMLRYGERRFRFFRKAITAWYEFMQFLFFVGTKAGLYRGAKSFLKNHKVDAIIATGEPFILFKYASALAKMNKTPWFADYRDPWSQSASRSKNILLKAWNSFFEVKYLNNVFAITTVSEFFKHQISELIVRRKIFIIPNGFHSMEYEPCHNKDSNTLKIAFAGSIYPWHPLESVLFKLHNFLASNPNAKIKLSFIGTGKGEYIAQLIDKEFHALKGQVFFTNKIPNQELIPVLKCQDLLLLFNDYSITGTKIFDYLAAKQRILLCYTNDTNANQLKKKHFPFKDESIKHNMRQTDIIEYTKSGYLIENQSELKLVLEALYEEFTLKGLLPCNSINLEEFTRKHQVEKLAKVLLNIKSK